MLVFVGSATDMESLLRSNMALADDAFAALPHNTGSNTAHILPAISLAELFDPAGERHAIEILKIASESETAWLD